jgi:hypothetical protein
MKEEIIILYVESKKEIRYSTIDTWVGLGKLLFKTKQSLFHGDFIPWIRKNMPFNERQAQRYIKMYKNQGLMNKYRDEIFCINDAMEIILKSKRSA